MVKKCVGKCGPCWGVLLVLLLVTLCGCGRVPLSEQFVSAKGELMLSLTDGECKAEPFEADTQEFDPTGGGLNPENIGIFSWNTYKGKMQGWQDDLLSLSGKSNLILLQEASKNEEMEEFLAFRRLYWNYNSAFKYKGIETGVLIASVEKPLYSCGLRQNEPIIGVPKTAIVSLYDIKGVSEKLLVANVHGINITLGTEAYKKQFNDLQNVLLQHRGPMLVTGDFNNWNEKRKAIVNVLVDTLNLTLIPFENENRTIMWGDAVDHVFYRGLEPVEHVSHKVASSDHNPIEVRFRLAREPERLNRTSP